MGVRNPIDVPGTLRQRLLIGAAFATVVGAIVVGLIAQRETPDLPDPARAKTRQVTVPKVIGEQPKAAVRELGSESLNSKFTFLGTAGRPCAGLPTAGHIIEQSPLPGAKVARRATVSLQTGCPEVVPPCQPYQLAVKASGSGADFPGTAGAQLVRVELAHIAGPPCEIDSTIYLQLLDSDGAVATEIAGNPTTSSINEKTGLGEHLEVGWFLGGRERPTRRLTVDARIGGSRVTGHVSTPLSDIGRLPKLSIGYYGGPALTRWNGRGSYHAALLTTRAYGQ